MNELGSDIEKLSLTASEEKVVSFFGRNLKLDTEEDAAEIVEAIKNCPGMTTLKLGGNTFGILAAKAIAKALESQPKFEKALWGDMFTQRTEHEIPDALNYLSSGITLANAHLFELDLSDNAFGPRGLKGIINLLKSPSCYSLQELRLNNNGLGITGGKMLATALSQCVTKSREDGSPLALKLFICGRNRLENEGSLSIANFLKEVRTLEHVAMPQNGINAKGIAGLAAAFACNPNLKYISLEDNTFTKKGAEVMAQHLPVLKNLETINFGDCLIRTKGAKALGDVLKDNFPKLQELYLGYNEIHYEGGLAIIEGLKNKKELKKVDLNGNKFGEKGIKSMGLKIKEFGKADEEILGSMNDDEGTEDEEEQSDDEDAESDGSENEEELEESLDSTVTVADFLSEPTFSKLTSLHKANTELEAFLPKEPTLADYFDLFLKLSSIIKPDDSKTTDAVYYYSDLLFEKVYSMYTNDNVWILNNELAVRLGLIKDEDRKKKTLMDLTGALLVLNYITRKKYFHTTTKVFLQEFLSRPLKYVTADMKVKHALLQVLYQA